MYQTNPQALPKELLPTMYDLPSEDPKEPGLPDEFHSIQPVLLLETFRPPHYPNNQIFTGHDINLYYDSSHFQWYKRPDWFAVIGVPVEDLRLSYVVWQEEVNPFIVVEFLSPGTEDEDLGRRLRSAEQPPGKWEVYEQILRIPYYVIYDRYEYQFRIFKLNINNRYEEITPLENRLWMPELEIGLGVWQGTYRNFDKPWLRWYDSDGNWILTPAEQAEQRAKQAEQRAEQAEQQAEQAEQQAEQAKQQAEQAKLEKENLIAQLKALGIELNTLSLPREGNDPSS